jgi:SAM-dependent methyltransferase
MKRVLASFASKPFASKQYYAYPQLLNALVEELKELAGWSSLQRIIDVGGGNGAVARFAARATGARVWCVDPAAPAKNSARGKIKFVKARAEALPFENGFFDAALACFSLEYCRGASCAAALASRAAASAPNAARLCSLCCITPVLFGRGISIAKRERTARQFPFSGKPRQEARLSAAWTSSSAASQKSTA